MWQLHRLISPHCFRPLIVVDLLVLQFNLGVALPILPYLSFDSAFNHTRFFVLLSCRLPSLQRQPRGHTIIRRTLHERGASMIQP